MSLAGMIRQKSQQLPSDLFSLLAQSKEPIYIDDLENMLDEFMLSLNTEIDGSIEEAASDDEDDDVSSRDSHTKMAFDAPGSRPNMNQNDMMVEEPSPVKAAEAEDGWTVVSSSPSKGRRN